ncbi:HD domain-containing protein [Loigolactobacillus backii]|nr:HD domain-containing protein [Loigolactobacillus backii]
MNERGFTVANVNYRQELVPFDRKTLLERIKAQLSDGRFQHVLRVEQTALDLAERYGGDKQRAGLAGLVHDYAKQRPDEEYKALIRTEGFDPELLAYNNGIWHGVVGAFIIERELGIHDEQILNAVRRHTIGSDNMTRLDKIIFVADFIEPGRDFPGIEAARQAAATSLDAGVAFEIKQTLNYLLSTNKKIYPKTIATYNAYVAK